MLKQQEIEEILSNLGINNPNIELYDTGTTWDIISLFNNGNYYNFYNVKSEDYEMTGPYKDLEEAQSFLLAKNPDSILVYKYNETDNFVGSGLFEWQLPFHFNCEIAEDSFEDAYNYLIEDEMRTYYDKKGKNRIKSIKYILQNCSGGYIKVITDTDKLSKYIKSDLIDWLNDFQDSALNEGIENQDWAKDCIDQSNQQWLFDGEIVIERTRICDVDNIELIGELDKSLVD